MTDQPTRVRVWASQLWRNDFPPVCAMTGRPAEVWRKFKFATVPDWAYSLLILVFAGGIGAIVYAVVARAVAQRASGYLPLTRSSSRVAGGLRWAPLILVLAAIVSWIVWLSTASDGGRVAQGVAFASAVLGLLLLFGAFVVRLLVRPLVCPRAKVMEAAPGQTDRIVELRNVHPAFVTAVQSLQYSRTLQMQGRLSPYGSSRG